MKRISISIVFTSIVILTMVVSMFFSYSFLEVSLEENLVEKEIENITVHQRVEIRNFNDWLVSTGESIERYANVISKTDFSNLNYTTEDLFEIIEQNKDGAYRSKKSLFDGRTESGIWLQAGHEITDETSNLFLGLKDITDVFGPGVQINASNIWTLPSKGGIVIFWPEEGGWIYNSDANMDYLNTDWVNLTRPENNPERQAKWTPLLFDPPSGWMTSVVAPIYIDNKWAGAVGHDFPLYKMSERINNISPFDESIILLTHRDGRFIYSSKHQDAVLKSGGNMTLDDIKYQPLKKSIEKLKNAKNITPDSVFIESPSGGDQIYISSIIPNTDWVISTIIPKSNIYDTVATAYRFYWIILSFVILVAVLMMLILFALVVMPFIRDILTGTQEMVSGNYKQMFKRYWILEFNKMSYGLNQIAKRILGDLEKEKEHNKKVLELNNNLMSALNEAENAYQVKSVFLANVSHEIRTPLNAILGFSNILKDSLIDKTNEEEKEYFELIDNSGKRLLRTIHGILDISQLETKTLTLNENPVNIKSVINQVLKELKSLIEQKGLNVILDFKTNNTMIDGDDYTITQAFSNIVENALKYTTNGSINISLEEKNNNLILIVKDTGIGISNSFMKQIFGAFTQESTGTTRKYEGLGLGLALTKRYIDANNGIIEIDSEVNVGTTVTVTFKLREDL